MQLVFIFTYLHTYLMFTVTVQKSSENCRQSVMSATVWWILAMISGATLCYYAVFMWSL